MKTPPLHSLVKQLLFISVLASMLCVGSCSVQKSVSGRNVSYLYKTGDEALLLDYRVVNTPLKSIVYFKFPASQLGTSEDETGVTRMGYSMRYRVFTSYSAPQAIDSGNIVRKDLLHNPNMDVIDTLVLDQLEQRYYIVEVSVRDLHSPKHKNVFVDVQRSSKPNDQSLIFSSFEKGMLYENVVHGADSLKVYYTGESTPLYAKVYNREFPVASPPFAVVAPKPFDFTPDKVVQLTLTEDGGRLLHITQRGFYQVTDDTNQRQGATIYNFGAYFPEAKTVMDLALPLRYITTNEEYNLIMSGEQIKKAVDAYWLKVGGSPQRARELIRSYYERVQYANKYFSSYLEGWKSDRGMAYIVYGPPDFVYRSTSTETWLYGEEGRYNALSLTFTKVVNPFTNNDYRLNRAASLKTSWYRAVEFWRQGRVLKYE